MSKQLLEKIATEFHRNNGFEKCSDVVLKLDRLLNQGVLARKLLNEIADELDEWHRKSAIAKVVGSSAGIGGTVAGTIYRCYVASYVCNQFYSCWRRYCRSWSVSQPRYVFDYSLLNVCIIVYR